MVVQELNQLDSIDYKILAELQANARITFAELGRRIPLSTPAVIERVRRLEEQEVIVGYHARVNPASIGLPVRAIIKISVAGDRLSKFATLVRTIPEVLECYRVTGQESYIAQVAASNTVHLESIIDSMMPYVSTNTSMILASPIPWNPVVPQSSTLHKRFNR